MKLEATCLNCRRRFLLSQIKPEPEGTGGRCPFCGFRFGRHYVQLLPQIVEGAESAADAFRSTLEQLQDMRPGFEIDHGALLKRISEELVPPEPREESA
jgi:DNA-directed RNA polymerase subunit RPC12/RpoP